MINYLDILDIIIFILVYIGLFFLLNYMNTLMSSSWILTQVKSSFDVIEICVLMLILSIFFYINKNHSLKKIFIFSLITIVILCILLEGDDLLTILTTLGTLTASYIMYYTHQKMISDKKEDLKTKKDDEAYESIKCHLKTRSDVLKDDFMNLDSNKDRQTIYLQLFQQFQYIQDEFRVFNTLCCSHSNMNIKKNVSFLNMRINYIYNNFNFVKDRIEESEYPAEMFTKDLSASMSMTLPSILPLYDTVMVYLFIPHEEFIVAQIIKDLNERIDVICEEITELSNNYTFHYEDYNLEYIQEDLKPSID